MFSPQKLQQVSNEVAFRYTNNGKSNNNSNTNKISASTESLSSLAHTSPLAIQKQPLNRMLKAVKCANSRLKRHTYTHSHICIYIHILTYCKDEKATKHRKSKYATTPSTISITCLSRLATRTSSSVPYNSQLIIIIMITSTTCTSNSRQL